MQLKLSHVPSPVPWHRGPVAALWTLSVVLFLFAVGVVTDGVAARSELPSAKRRLVALETALAAIDKVAIPTDPELRSMRSRVDSLNAVERGVRGRGANALLATLEGLQPESVYLTSLRYRRRTGEATIVAESTNVPSLTTYLLNLEREPTFAETMLDKQGGRTGAREGRQVEIRLRFDR